MRIDKYTKKAIKATLVQSILGYAVAIPIIGFIEWDITKLPCWTWDKLTTINEWDVSSRFLFLFNYLCYWIPSIIINRLKSKGEW